MFYFWLLSRNFKSQHHRTKDYTTNPILLCCTSVVQLPGVGDPDASLDRHDPDASLGQEYAAGISMEPNEEPRPHEFPGGPNVVVPEGPGPNLLSHWWSFGSTKISLNWTQ